jgi:hypothetical protein
VACAGGTGYFCGSCNKTFDDSLVRLQKKPRAVTSTIGDPLTRSQSIVFTHVAEDKGFNTIEDEYARHDPE